MNHVEVKLDCSKISWFFYESNINTASGFLPIDNNLLLPNRLNWVHLELKDLLDHLKPDRVIINEVGSMKDEVMMSYLNQLLGVIINSVFEVVQCKMEMI